MVLDHHVPQQPGKLSFGRKGMGALTTENGVETSRKLLLLRTEDPVVLQQRQRWVELVLHQLLFLRGKFRGSLNVNVLIETAEVANATLQIKFEANCG